MKGQLETAVVLGGGEVELSDNADLSEDEESVADGVPEFGCLKTNILGKVEEQHLAKPMETFPHDHYQIKENIIIAYDFTELKGTTGSQLFRVRNLTCLYIFSV